MDKKCSINSDGGYSPRIYLVPSAWSVALCILIYLMPETICGMCADTVTDEEIQIT